MSWWLGGVFYALVVLAVFFLSGSLPPSYLLATLALAGGALIFRSAIDSQFKKTGLSATLEALEKMGRDEDIGGIYLEGEWAPLGEAVRRTAGFTVERLRDLQEEKSKLETILAHMVDGVVLFSARKRVLLLNPAAEGILGVGREMIGARGLELYRHLPLDEALDRVLASGVGTTLEVRLYHPGEKDLQVFLSPVRGGDEGKPSGVLLVLRDVSQERAVEKMRREFVADVTHELQTPLTSILGYVETLQEGVEDAATRERFLGVVQVEAKRLSRLLDDLLDLSRIQAGVLSYRQDLLDLGATVRDVAGRFRPRAEQDGRCLELHLPDEPLPVRGDADRLGQVLWNLLVNADKYTPAGGGIRVRVGKDGPWATVAVEDDGVGIPAEELPRIFDRFYRVDKGRSRQSGGTGLGLPIARGIVEAHGGRVEARSKVGKGSEFIVRLPLHKEEQSG